jgi:ubiquinone/menaquinone biosynthesis C-methylase UbiE
MNDNIDWKAYYLREPEVCDFDPRSNATEMHRCMAAWSVWPSGKIESILDAGCGDGFFCHWIRGKIGASRVAGADISEKRLERARGRYPGIEYVEGELPKLPFKDGEFEVVTCIEVLEHQVDPAAALKELARIARRFVIVTVPNGWPLTQVLCPHCLKTFPAAGHLHVFDPERLRQLAEEVSLSAERIRSYSLTVGLVAMVLPRPLGAAAAWILNLVRRSPGTFLAARFRKA